MTGAPEFTGESSSSPRDRAARDRSVVVIPTYDNPRTIEDVVRRTLAIHPHVIVVDDGSRPEGRSAIDAAVAAHPTVQLRRHESNRGKGAALRTGLDAASELGFATAVTLDGDGQHHPEDLPTMLEAIAEHPEALILGNRDFQSAGAGRGSRWGRINSNFWTFVETGLRLPDTQTGYRAYPVEETRALALYRNGYAFEIEVIVRAAWTGIPIHSVPVRVTYFSGEERVSHMRPLVDFIRIGHLNTRFVLQRFAFPKPYLAWRSKRAYHEKTLTERWRSTFRTLFIEEPGTPSRIALSVALGLFMGIAPVWGFQIILALLFAHWLDLSKPIAVLASHISFPLMIPVILYTSLVTGRWLLRSEEPTALDPSLTSLPVGSEDFIPWIVGSFALAATVSALGGSLTYTLLALRKNSGPEESNPPNPSRHEESA